jgi:branched-chain amino acid transport system permease protein
MSLPAIGIGRNRRNLYGLLGLGALVAIMPVWLDSPYALSTMVLIGIDTIVTLGLCLLMGYAGQISLGQAAFFGIGAYGSAILTTRFSWSPWLALPAAALCTGALAYLIGMPVFRLSGHYLAMGTLAFGSIVHIGFTEWKRYTGGPTGLPGIPRLTVAGAPIKSDLAYYYLVWVVALVAVALALNLVNSRFGRALRAIRDSQPAAESIGIDVARCKLQVLVISALYASVAGSLYAHYLIFISPQVGSLDVSIRLVLMAAVGGMASIWGAPFGAATVMLLTLGLREVVPLFTGYGSGEHQIIAYGLLLILIMLFMPEGVTLAALSGWRSLYHRPALRRLLSSWQKRR